MREIYGFQLGLGLGGRLVADSIPLSMISDNQGSFPSMPGPQSINCAAGAEGTTMKLKFRSIILAAALVPMTAAAQQELGNINVTAQGVQASSLSSPKSVTIIDRATIESSHATFVTDLLKGQSGLLIRDTSSNGSSSKVDIGGFGETAHSNVVVMIDGRRVNSPDLSGVDWTQIPVEQIERIEIIHGTASVLYGNGAVGGVINIITRIPEAGGNIRIGGGSFGSSDGAIRVGADSGKTRMELNFSGKKTNGYRDNSRYESFDGGVRAEMDITEKVSLRISGNHHTDRAGLPGALTAAEAAANPKQTKKPNDWGKTTDSFVDTGMSVAYDSGIELDVAAGFRKRDTSSAFYFPAPFPVSSTLRTRTLRPKFSYSNSGAVSTIILVGSEFEWSDGQVSSFDYQRDRRGLYGMVNLGFMDDRVHLSAGYRHETMDDAFGVGGATTISNNKNAWEAGGAFDLGGGFQVKGEYAHSLRLPALDERYTAAIPAWAIPASLNTALLPQTGNHVNASIAWTADDIHAEVAFSRADITNEIFYNPATFANENYTSKTRHDVFRVAAGWDINEWAKLSANYTQTKATFRGGSYNGNRVPAVADSTFGASWKAEWFEGASTQLNVAYVGSSYFVSDQANANAKLAAYTVWDVVANYRLKAWELFARIDNLTNEHYATYGAYTSVYPAAAMQLRAGASYRF